jgi:hypothetical protein
MEEESNPAVESGQTGTGTAEQQPAVVQTPQQQAVASEEGHGGPSQEDLTKGIAKWRSHAKEMEAEVAKLRAQVPSTPTAPIQPTSAPLSPEADAGLAAIEQRMQAVVAPIQDKLEASERVQTTERFWQDPTARAMAPEIQAEFNRLSPSLPYETRLETAKGMAIANNLPMFQKVYEQIGIEKAYNNQSLKNGQRSANASGARQLNVEQKTILEKLESGEIKAGSPEYIANREEILAAERKSFGL